MVLWFLVSKLRTEPRTLHLLGRHGAKSPAPGFSAVLVELLTCLSVGGVPVFWSSSRDSVGVELNLGCNPGVLQVGWLSESKGFID